MTPSTAQRLQAERRTGRKPATLTPRQEASLRSAAEDGLSQRELARRFGVSVATVSRVVRGEDR